MKELFKIVQKNFKLLIRSKTSALIIFIGPLILVSLLGLAFSQSSSFLLTTSVYSDSYTELTDNMIEKMKSQNLQVIKQNSESDCITSLKIGESQSCVIFPPDISIEPGQKNELTFYVDYTQMNLVWVIINSITGKIKEENQEISQQLVTDLLERMMFVDGKIKEARSEISKLKENENAIKSNFDEAKSEVQKIDLNIDFGSADLTKTEPQTANASVIANLVMIKVAADVENALTKTTNTIDDLNNIKNQVDDNATEEDLQNSIDDLETAKSYLNRTINFTTTQNTELKAIISNISTIISEVKAKLTASESKIRAAAQSKNKAITKFSSIDSQLQTILSEIDNTNTLIGAALEKIQSLKIKEAEQIVSPITSQIEPVVAQKSHFHSLFPTLLVIIVMITGILLSSTMVIVEKRSKAFFRNAISPINYFTFNIANYISSLLIIIVQLILFISVAEFYFNVNIISNIGNVAIIIFLMSTMFIFFGILLGFLFRNEETVTLSSITLASAFLLFSNAIIPLESMPAAMKNIAYYNPFVISEAVLKKAIMFQFDFKQLLPYLYPLLIYAVAIIAIILVLHTTLKRIAFMHFQWFHYNEKKAEMKITANNGEQKNNVVNNSTNTVSNNTADKNNITEKNNTSDNAQLLAKIDEKLEEDLGAEELDLLRKL